MKSNLSEAGETQPGDAERSVTFFESLMRRDDFWVLTELRGIDDLQDKGELNQAHRKATALIERPSNSFSSVKYERHLKGLALYRRAHISKKLFDIEGFLNDMEKAANLGHPNAPSEAATWLMFRSIREPDSSRRQAALEKVYAYYLMGAELGNSDCYEYTQAICREKGQREEEHYWFLLKQMAQDIEAIRQVDHLYRQYLTTSFRAFLDRVMCTRSLSGGEVASTISGLPGRTTLTAAFVDLNMRRFLRFVWSANFKEDGPKSTLSMEEVFHGYRKAIREKNPLADLWLLINRRYRANSDAISLTLEQLVKNILPGDQILVRSGSLVHYSTIWAVGQAKQEVLLMDPFHEFWLPTHNPGVTVFETRPYKYERSLIRVSLPELKRMLVAVMTIRDCAP